MNDYLELLNVNSQFQMTRSLEYVDEARFIESRGYKLTDRRLTKEIMNAAYLKGLGQGLQLAADIYKTLNPYDY